VERRPPFRRAKNEKVSRRVAHCRAGTQASQTR
jgi:hypothetical protein